MLILCKFATMVSDINEQINRISAKASVIVEKYLRLKEAYDSLREENTSLKAQLVARDKEVEQLKMKVEHLSIASVVKVSGPDLEATRAMVADLVHEIDSCIADLYD